MRQITTPREPACVQFEQITEQVFLPPPRVKREGGALAGGPSSPSLIHHILDPRWHRCRNWKCAQGTVSLTPEIELKPIDFDAFAVPQLLRERHRPPRR